MTANPQHRRLPVPGQRVFLKEQNCHHDGICLAYTTLATGTFVLVLLDSGTTALCSGLQPERTQMGWHLGESPTRTWKRTHTKKKTAQ